MINTTTTKGILSLSTDLSDLTKPVKTERGKKNTYLSPHLKSVCEKYIDSKWSQIYIDCIYTVEEHQTRFVIINIIESSSIELSIESCRLKSVFNDTVSDPGVKISYIKKYKNGEISDPIEKLISRTDFEGNRKYSSKTPLEMLTSFLGDLYSEKYIENFDSSIFEKRIIECFEYSKQVSSKEREVYEKKEKEKEEIGKLICQFFDFTQPKILGYKFEGWFEVISGEVTHEYKISDNCVTIYTRIDIKGVSISGKEVSQDISFSTTYNIEDFIILETKELASRVFHKYSRNEQIYVPESSDGYRGAGYINGSVSYCDPVMRQTKIYYLKFKNQISNWFESDLKDTIIPVIQYL